MVAGGHNGIIVFSRYSMTVVLNLKFLGVFHSEIHLTTSPYHSHSPVIVILIVVVTPERNLGVLIWNYTKKKK